MKLPSKRRFVRPLAHIHIELDFQLKTNKDIETLTSLFEGMKKKKATE